MAATETTRPAPFGAIATYRVISAFGGAFSAFNAWTEARRTRVALSRLTDRELDDIGLCRADIDRI